MSDIQEEIKFPIREAREMVKDLMVPNAFISVSYTHLTLPTTPYV